jgi:hypothetical protein
LTPPIRRRFVDTAVGPIHVATCGTPDAPAVVLQHQTPRSWLVVRSIDHASQAR